MSNRATSAGAVILRGGCVLLLQRVADDSFPELWELPSGRSEAGESPLDTLRREVYEETGLTVVQANQIGSFEYVVEKAAGTTMVTQTNYRVTTDDASVVCSEEHQAFAWVPRERLDRYDMSGETRATIETVLVPTSA